MSILAPDGLAFVPAKQLFASHEGEWVEVLLGGGSAYQRPSEWLATNVTPGEQKVQMLALVSGVTQQSLAATVNVTVSGGGGTFLVDWGDGTIPAPIPNGTLSHTFDVAQLGAPIASGPNAGYYQALVTITPSAGGTLTGLDVMQPFVSGKTWRNPYVEIVVGPSLTSFVVSNVNTTDNPVIERIELLSPLNVVSSSTCAFWQCTRLVELIGTINYSGTSLASLFTNCYNLVTTPTINVTPACTQLTSTFNNCRNIVDPPVVNGTSGVLNYSSCFANCQSLAAVPVWDYSAANDFSSMFSNCTGLKDGGAWTFTKAGTVVNNMFVATGIERVGPFTNGNLVTNWGSCFVSCNRLRRIEGSLDLSGTLATLTFLTGCVALERLVLSVGPSWNVTIVGLLDAAQLNAIYTALPSVGTARTITVTGVPGGAGDDPTIATAKNWTVTGS